MGQSPIAVLVQVDAVDRDGLGDLFVTAQGRREQVDEDDAVGPGDLAHRCRVEPQPIIGR